MSKSRISKQPGLPQPPLAPGTELTVTSHGGVVRPARLQPLPRPGSPGRFGCTGRSRAATVRPLGRGTGNLPGSTEHLPPGWGGGTHDSAAQGIRVSNGSPG